MARDIALIEPDPEDWGGWVLYFLEQMEAEAHRRRKDSGYTIMSNILNNDLQDMIKR
jgi:hypothetical protein